jgi:hypothetical protein
MWVIMTGDINLGSAIANNVAWVMNARALATG